MKSLTIPVPEQDNKIKFPILAKNLRHDFVVMFKNETSGTIVFMPKYCDCKEHYIGRELINDWIDVSRADTWLILPKGFEVRLIQE